MRFAFDENIIASSIERFATTAGDLSRYWKVGDKVKIGNREAIVEEIRNGYMFGRYEDKEESAKPYTATRDGIEFDEDLYLYKAQMYDSDMNQEYERYIVAMDFEDATAIAKAYFEDKCVSVTGIWQVDIVIGRYYE